MSNLGPGAGAETPPAPGADAGSPSTPADDLGSIPSSNNWSNSYLPHWPVRMSFAYTVSANCDSTAAAAGALVMVADKRQKQ